MGLVIEISVNIMKTNLSNTKFFLSELAHMYNCISEYYIYETEGYNCKIERNDCIQVVNFEFPFCENMKNNLINYLIKIINKKNINIETIYIDEESTIDVIYNSIKSDFIDINGKQKIIKTKPLISDIKEQLYYYF